MTRIIFNETSYATPVDRSLRRSFNYSNLFDPFLTEVTLIIMGNLDISASKENPEGHANLRFFLAAAIVLTWLWKNSG
jgi:hypothetical protein